MTCSFPGVPRLVLLPLHLLFCLPERPFCPFIRGNGGLRKWEAGSGILTSHFGHPACVLPEAPHSTLTIREPLGGPPVSVILYSSDRSCQVWVIMRPRVWILLKLKYWSEAFLPEQCCLLQRSHLVWWLLEETPYLFLWCCWHHSQHFWKSSLELLSLAHSFEYFRGVWG